MPAVFTRVKTWVSNEVLTAADLNAEINNLLNNTIPASIDDYSVDVSTMQTAADPGGLGTESLPITLAGEIQRLRFKIKQLMNGAYWYSTPVGSLSNLGILTANINDLAVTTAKVVDGAITPIKRTVINSNVFVSAGNGYGSTNTWIRRFTNNTTVGSDITYADSATLGATFTINTTGLYFITRNDGAGSSQGYIGFSVNGTVATQIQSLLTTERIAVINVPAFANIGTSVVVYLTAGSIVRAHDGTSAMTTTDQTLSLMRIARID